MQTDRGYIVLSIKQILPAHQGSLEEVRDSVVAELKQEKASAEARTKADELVKRVKAGEKFDAAAKALGLEAKTSEEFARSGYHSQCRQRKTTFRRVSIEGRQPWAAAQPRRELARL